MTKFYSASLLLLLASSLTDAKSQAKSHKEAVVMEGPEGCSEASKFLTGLTRKKRVMGSYCNSLLASSVTVTAISTSTPTYKATVNWARPQADGQIPMGQLYTYGGYSGPEETIYPTAAISSACNCVLDSKFIPTKTATLVPAATPTCGIKGCHRDNGIISISKGLTKSECQSKCGITEKCSAYHYGADADISYCNLFQVPIDEAFSAGSSSDKSYCGQFEFNELKC